MKFELREAQEREKQFIKIVKSSPELLAALDMDESSMLEARVPVKPQEEILVSSKMVPI